LKSLSSVDFGSEDVSKGKDGLGSEGNGMGFHRRRWDAEEASGRKGKGTCPNYSPSQPINSL